MSESKKNNTSFVVIILSLMLSFAAGIVGPIYYYRDQLSSIGLAYDSLGSIHDNTLKELENNNSINAVDPRIVEWAYKNADKKVARISIIQYLEETQRYDKFLMLVSIMQVESKFNLYAVSNKGAKGLGQITTKIWLDELTEAGLWKEEIDVYDYRKNIAAIDYIVRKLLKEHKSWPECLNRYVGGDKDYVTKVLSNYAELTLLLTNTEKEEIYEKVES